MSARKHGIAGWLLVAAFVTGGAGPTAGQDRGRGPQRSEARGIVKSIDTGAGTITVSTGERRGEPVVDKTYSLAKNVEVAIGASSGRGGLFKEGKLADLTAGVGITLTLSADEKTVESILAEEPSVRGRLTAVDTAKNTLTMSVAVRRDQEGEERTYALAPDVEVAVDDGRGSRFSIKEAKLTDLARGAEVTVRLSIDRKQVQGVLAEGPTSYGTIKALDPAKNTLTLVVRPPRGDDAGEERTLAVSSDAVVLLDDGKGRRLSLKRVKLTDLPAGSAAAVKLSVDQTVIMSIRAEGSTLSGLLKAVDPDKGIIVLAIPKGRSEEPEEKTLTVAKDARIALDGAESKLTNLKVGDPGTAVQLRLALDQKTVQSITAQQLRPR
jgi:hypothetical protein